MLRPGLVPCVTRRIATMRAALHTSFVLAGSAGSRTSASPLELWAAPPRGFRRRRLRIHLVSQPFDKGTAAQQRAAGRPEAHIRDLGFRAFVPGSQRLDGRSAGYARNALFIRDQWDRHVQILSQLAKCLPRVRTRSSFIART